MVRPQFSRRSRTGTAPVGALRRNYDVVCNIALAFQGVEATTSYGTLALKVKGRLMDMSLRRMTASSLRGVCQS